MSISGRSERTQTIFITGATGFVGREVVDLLLASGFAVRSIFRTVPPAERPGLTSVQDDLSCSEARWSELLDGVDAVCHLGWSTVPHTANQDPVRDIEVNVLGTLRLASAAAKAGVRMIFASSGGTVYGRLGGQLADERSPLQPTSFYGAAKLVAENHVRMLGQAAGTGNVSLRIANLYGPGQGGTSNFGAVANFAAKAVANEELVIWGDGLVVRDYVYVTDVAQAILVCLHSPMPPPVLNIGSGTGKSLADILEAIRYVLDRPLRVRYEPARAYDIPRSVLDISLARETIGWKPSVMFEEGVARTIRVLAGNALPDILTFGTVLEPDISEALTKSRML